MGGDWISRIKSAVSRSVRHDRRLVDSMASRMCSRALDRVGVDSQQGQEAGHREVTRWRKASASAKRDLGGAANDRNTISGRPALLPGV